MIDEQKNDIFKWIICIAQNLTYDYFYFQARCNELFDKLGEEEKSLLWIKFCCRVLKTNRRGVYTNHFREYLLGVKPIMIINRVNKLGNNSEMYFYWLAEVLIEVLGGDFHNDADVELPVSIPCFFDKI